MVPCMKTDNMVYVAADRILGAFVIGGFCGIVVGVFLAILLGARFPV